MPTFQINITEKQGVSDSHSPEVDPDSRYFFAEVIEFPEDEGDPVHCLVNSPAFCKDDKEGRKGAIRVMHHVIAEAINWQLYPEDKP